MNALYSQGDQTPQLIQVMHFEADEFDETAPIQVKVTARVHYSGDRSDEIFPEAFIAAVSNRLAESSDSLYLSAKPVPYTEVSP